MSMGVDVVPMCSVASSTNFFSPLLMLRINLSIGRKSSRKDAGCPTVKEIDCLLNTR